MFKQLLRQPLSYVQDITVLGTSSRIPYELWNENSVRWWYWKKRLFTHLYSILVISCTFALVQKKNNSFILVYFCQRSQAKLFLQNSQKKPHKSTKVGFFDKTRLTYDYQYDVQIHRNDVVSGTIFNMCVVLPKYSIELNIFSFCRILTQCQGLRSRLMLENTEGAIKNGQSRKTAFNWQHRVHRTKKNKTQHNMYWTPLYASKHKLRK